MAYANDKGISISFPFTGSVKAEKNGMTFRETASHVDGPEAAKEFACERLLSQLTNYTSTLKSEAPSMKEHGKLAIIGPRIVIGRQFKSRGKGTNLTPPKKKRKKRS